VPAGPAPLSAAARGARRLGVLGGSFDPPHLGHLHAARRARDAFALEHVVFVPAARPPHKPERILAEGAERLEMLALLLADEPDVSVWDTELGRSGPSYTVDTLRELRPARAGAGALLPDPGRGQPGGLSALARERGDRAPGAAGPGAPRGARRARRSPPTHSPRSRARAWSSGAWPRPRWRRARPSCARRWRAARSRASWSRRGWPSTCARAGCIAVHEGACVSAGGSARFVGVALAAALATLALARLARRIGWTDAAQGPDAARKLQLRPVPAVGGAALLLALACAGESPWSAAEAALWNDGLPAPAWRWAALALVFGVGLWDDRARLAPGAKALAQLAALAPLALGAGLAGRWSSALWLLALGFLALNALNTFDNADGCLASLCALGFAPVAPLVTAASLGFLPLNLDAARHPERRAPSAYLGDSGAFVLGFLVLVNPGAAGVLVLPLLDLARLSVARVRAGSRPWLGDRRHLAHRLAARGLGAPAVALLQCAIAAPACLLVARADTRLALAGCAATAVAFACALRAAPEARVPAV
jgi:cytidyltransferase-like protein